MYRIPDRIKFFSAVATTAILPTSMRIKSRSALLGRLQRSKTRNADIIVACHPKSGSTWFRVMLSRLYQMRYDLPPQRIVKSDEFYNRNRSLPRFLVSNGHYAYEAQTQTVLDEAGPGMMDGKKLIFLARNPCDVAVSWFLQFTKRTKAFKRELINSTLRHPVDPHSIEMWDFVMHEELGLPGLIEFHNMWERRVNESNAGMIVRYEDLRSKPVDTLSQVSEFLGAPFNREEIEHSVEFASFDNMRKLEQEGYFHNAGMALRNKNDPDTLKVRRAKVGGFRDYFTSDQVAIMDEMIRDRLSPTLGYEPAPASEAASKSSSSSQARL